MVVLAALPFLHVVDHKAGTGYAALPTNERTRRNSNVLHRTRSNGSKNSGRFSSSAIPQPEPSKLMCSFSIFSSTRCLCQPFQPDNDERDDDSDETSSLLSGPGDLLPEDDAASKTSRKSNHSHCLDITGVALLYKFEFWQIWVIMGLLTGVGLMTIK